MNDDQERRERIPTLKDYLIVLVGLLSVPLIVFGIKMLIL